MTNDDQKKLETFFDSVVDALSTKYVEFHWPNTLCFGDSCEDCGLSRTNSSDLECNWKDIRDLVVEFFRDAPDVPQTWGWRTWQIGLDPAEFHDLLLGIFLGSVHPRKRYRSYGEWFPPQKGARL